MASNFFGTLFKITTWGESHGKAIGVIIDGCPAGLEISEKEIDAALARRAPGKSPYTSPRLEEDRATIYSGIFEGKTTGTPISILIPNKDPDSSKYAPIKNLLRPGHATFTYLEKYGIFDYRGGGRASARETAVRVAAGAVAKKFLALNGIEVTAFLKQIGPVSCTYEGDNNQLRTHTLASPLFCPDPTTTKAMMRLLDEAIAEGDSLGGIVEFRIVGAPAGLGEPLYQKLEATLAHAMMGLPATKGFEIGEGFSSVQMKGSEHNDGFIVENETIQTASNHAGGILAGISTGMPIVGSVAFKPTSSIKKTQPTVTVEKESALFELPQGSRHDPCVAIRAVPVVEAMAALVIADALLLNRCSQI